MRSIPEFESIFLHRGYVDMRKSIYGLSVIVSEEMRLDLKSRSLFIFCNKKRTHLKILYFDKSGFALWFKKLEEMKFPWPKQDEESVISIQSKDLEMMLDGINIWTKFKEVHFEYIV
jgi:transposase